MPRARTLLVIAAALFALAFLAAPWFAFRALRDAAETGDARALAELVDYPAVRAGLRLQLKPAAAPAPADPWRDPVGALKRMIEPLQPAPPSLDRHLTPQGLYALTVGAPDGPPPAATREPWPRLAYWGFRRVRFGVGDVTLTFQRRGVFAWRLTHVALSEGGEATSDNARAAR